LHLENYTMPKQHKQYCRVEIHYSFARLEKIDQAMKSVGWMPWHQEPKKDVASCEKLWGAASRH
jgi:hypothetical protein